MNSKSQWLWRPPGYARVGFGGWNIAVASVMLLAALFLQFLLPNQTLNRLDGIAYDAKLNLAPPIPEALANIQIVDIDERSLLEIERMPWRRSLYADLTNQLNDLGALVIVFDVLFAEPQPNPAKAVLDHMRQQGRSHENTDEAATLSRFNYDQIFADSISQTEVVLGTLLHQQAPISKGVLRSDSVTQSDSSLKDSIKRYTGYAGLTKTIAEPSAGQGFMNSVEDDDGFVRRAGLLAKVGNIYYPSLAAEAFRVYSLADVLEPVWQSQGGQRFLAGVKIGSQIVPTDNQGRVLIPFKGPAKTYPYTSAADVLNGRADRAQFAESIVFVGTSASGLADLRVTPVTVNFPGVEIHATVFEALFAPERLIYRPDWWQGALALQLIVITVVILLSFPILGPTLMSLMTLVMVCITVGINLSLWHYQSIDIPVVAALVLTISMSGFFITSGFFSESRRRRQVKAIFDQYVPPAHIEELLDDSEVHTLEGEKKELSVMFSDIRSFTSISESMQAHELKQWLNQFFSPITKVIFEHDGTIDKYVGDMVMAFWGAPLEDPQHANKSITAAFAMLAAIEVLNETYRAKQLPIANIGIGINTGEMNVGDMGSDYRRAYTVIGDAVNLGSRLEGLTKFYGVSILVSEFTQAQTTDYDYLLVDKVKVKGKQKPVTIYTPLPRGLDEEQQTRQMLHADAMSHYFDKDFESAAALFEQLKSSHFYTALVTLFLERSHYWLANPPDANWDGSFTHTTK